MEYKGIELKTSEGWGAFADSADKGDFDYYCKPGDLVDESIFDHFLNSVPPHRWKDGYLQAGEAYDCAYNPERQRTEFTYKTFKWIYKGVYMFLGNCFTGGQWDAEAYKYKTIAEFLEKTYRVNPAIEMQETRPHIFCADGFEISVQAGDGLYSRPRRNAKKFEAAECGFPSQAEELLMKYKECGKDKPEKSVYPYVPLDVIEEVLEKHGGPRTH